MVYELQKEPDKSVTLQNGSVCTPVATLKDEYGGVSHIIIDDHCYVLVNGNGTSEYWYTEAVGAMHNLPIDPRDLEPIICV